MSAPTLDDTDRVTGELIDTYLPIAQEADHRINPRRWRLADYSAAEQGSVFRSYEDALQWMDSSASIIRGCIRIANTLGRREESWQYAEATQSFFRVRKDFRSWRISHEVAEESARGCGPTAHARMLASLGECHIWLEDIGVAEAYLQRARALWIKGRHVLGEASCLEALCMVEMKKGNPPKARQHASTARDMFSGQARERGVVLATRRVGETYLAEQDHRQALKSLEHAYDWFRDTGDVYQQVRTGRSLVAALRGSGRSDEANRVLQDLVGLAESIGAHTDAEELSRMTKPVTTEA
ncbi:hypothetical protein GCM10007079_04360 [Nocardiopsis terrae]|uniref:Tetratricopeptide (TPR) repeat protein n=1 Tax=Nocardiopsis terrae TaxID=372655 RepID=A0ABR9HNA1_9ACTN|nr:tetratricopeptide repeat protein [Nocardiopsis terrae]MBE1460487.1 tetratricopeptide (TPR) repeat protein [Nocardiopsis terrae]GHC71713.1 hypothetical protein GCM10007079_04360 [Nocardiopsis terrae]